MADAAADTGLDAGPEPLRGRLVLVTDAASGVGAAAAQAFRRSGAPVVGAQAALRATHCDEMPIGRRAEPEEVASARVVLDSPLAAHVAGATSLVDGAQNA